MKCPICEFPWVKTYFEGIQEKESSQLDGSFELPTQISQMQILGGLDVVW